MDWILKVLATLIQKLIDKWFVTAVLFLGSIIGIRFARIQYRRRQHLKRLREKLKLNEVKNAYLFEAKNLLEDYSKIASIVLADDKYSNTFFTTCTFLPEFFYQEFCKVITDKGDNSDKNVWARYVTAFQNGNGQIKLAKSDLKHLADRFPILTESKFPHFSAMNKFIQRPKKKKDAEIGIRCLLINDNDNRNSAIDNFFKNNSSESIFFFENIVCKNFIGSRNHLGCYVMFLEDKSKYADYLIVDESIVSSYHEVTSELVLFYSKPNELINTDYGKVLNLFKENKNVQKFNDFRKTRISNITAS
jgi:hypothetical protein